MNGPTGRAQVERIRSLIEVERYEEARTELANALAGDPDDPDLNGLLAQTLLGLDDPAGALAAASRLVALAPDDEWGQRLLALALARSGRPEDALAAAARAVQLGPDLWQTHHTYAQVALKAYRRLIDAAAAAQRAVELAPNEPQVHVVQGIVHDARSEFDEARAAYRRALALDADNAAARNNLAVLDGGLRLGRQTRGFLAALRADPGSKTVQENLEGFLPAIFLRLWLAFGTVLVLGLLITIHGDAPEESDPGPASYALLALVVVGSVAYVASLVRHLPAGVLRELWRRNRRSFLAMWGLVATLLIVGAAVVVCTVPGSGDFGVKMLRPLFLGLVIIGIATFVRRQNR